METYEYWLNFLLNIILCGYIDDLINVGSDNEMNYGYNKNINYTNGNPVSYAFISLSVEMSPCMSDI